MGDIVSPEKRSEMMSAIRGKNTKPEMLVRRALFARGLRYRLHDKRLPGKPDMVFPRRRAVLFINGCFWHGHDCHLFRMPASRQDFWQAKIGGNRSRDAVVREQLSRLGWRYLTIYECAIKGKARLPLSLVTDKIVAWLESDEQTAVIEGMQNGVGGPV
jgi:DNA mismatch endonuclease (patch repair protein)